MLGLFKLLPIFQLLFDIFKPGDGEQVTRGAKISALAIVALLLYSGFVSYAYIEQYHVVVQTTTQNAYQATALAEKKGELTAAKKKPLIIERNISRVSKMGHINSQMFRSVWPTPHQCPCMPLNQRLQSLRRKNRSAWLQVLGSDKNY